MLRVQPGWFDHYSRWRTAQQQRAAFRLDLPQPAAITQDTFQGGQISHQGASRGVRSQSSSTRKGSTTLDRDSKRGQRALEKQFAKAQRPQSGRPKLPFPCSLNLLLNSWRRDNRISRRMAPLNFQYCRLPTLRRSLLYLLA